MTWTLVIVAITGGIVSSNLNTQTIPMRNKEACLAAAKSFSERSNSVGFICVSSDSGEVISNK
jgi:hypothetical protein